MMIDKSITSFSNEKLKFVSKLKDKSFRDENTADENVKSFSYLKLAWDISCI